MKKTLKKFLEKNETCDDGFEFAKDLTLEQFLSTCERGDWILWLFRRTNPNDKRTRILVAAHCANTVRHLMRDQRSLDAVDIAIRYGNNQATDEELDAAAYAAKAAADAAADIDADADAAYAAYAVFAVFAANAGYAANAAANAAAEKANQKLTADICRQYLPIEIWGKI